MQNLREVLLSSCAKQWVLNNFQFVYNNQGSCFVIIRIILSIVLYESGCPWSPGISTLLGGTFEWVPWCSVIGASEPLEVTAMEILHFALAHC